MGGANSLLQSKHTCLMLGNLHRRFPGPLRNLRLGSGAASLEVKSSNMSSSLLRPSRCPSPSVCNSGSLRCSRDGTPTNRSAQSLGSEASVETVLPVAATYCTCMGWVKGNTWCRASSRSAACVELSLSAFGARLIHSLWQGQSCNAPQELCGRSCFAICLPLKFAARSEATADACKLFLAEGPRLQRVLSCTVTGGGGGGTGAVSATSLDDGLALPCICPLHHLADARPNLVCSGEGSNGSGPLPACRHLLLQELLRLLALERESDLDLTAASRELARYLQASSNLRSLIRSVATLTDFLRTCGGTISSTHFEQGLGIATAQNCEATSKHKSLILSVTTLLRRSKTCGGMNLTLPNGLKGPETSIPKCCARSSS
mmetsp:Transcript_82630/g.145774  ORF Transcript_82630/g.145774 Transcript_82630/m.145774 type:complete len:375 (+) Transcript_82630:1243-2367(+)